MQEFLKNKAGQYRFSQRDTEWLTYFAGEADSVVIQVQDLQKQATLDRAYINAPITVPDSGTKK